MAKVKVVDESSSGLNTLVSIDGVVYTNLQAYRLAKQGAVNGYHGVNNHGTKYIRSNPDNNKNNNIE